MNRNGLEEIEADLLFDSLTVQRIDPISTVNPHPAEIVVQRDRDLKIKLEMTGTISGRLEDRPGIRLGTVTEAMSTKGKGLDGSTIYLEGLTPTGRNVNGEGDFVIRGSLGRVIEEYGQSIAPQSTIMYLLGFPSGMPSRGSQREFADNAVLSRPDSPEMGTSQKITKKGKGHGVGSASDCILIKNKYGTVLFSEGAKNEISDPFKPSYLHFVEGSAVHDEEVRRSFLEAVNFSFGKRFVEIGHTELDRDHNPLRRSSRRPYSLNLATEVSSADLPPAFILHGYGFIHEPTVNLLVELFFGLQGQA